MHPLPRIRFEAWSMDGIRKSCHSGKRGNTRFRKYRVALVWKSDGSSIDAFTSDYPNCGLRIRRLV